MSNVRRFPVVSWADLKRWHQSFSLSPAVSQTTPIAKDEARPASFASDARDDEGLATVEDVSDVAGEAEEALDEGTDLVENDHEVLQLIASKEKTLIEIWEDGPAQLTVSQDIRIAYLEEKLAKTMGDNEYLEDLLKVRDNDFARYVDLERKQRRETKMFSDLADDLEKEVADLEDKLGAKDIIIDSMNAKLDCLLEVERTCQELIVQQKQLSKSTLVLVSKQKKTKMASTHSVQYTVTRPRPPVQEEIAMANKREWEKRKEEQRQDIVAMVNHVDRIAASFDRYQNTSTIITFSEPRSVFVPDHLFTWVEGDMIATWVFSVEPTKEELVKYEKHLEKQMRPDPIYSPTLPKATVNWNRLNPNVKRNLPEPVKFPLYGCAQDPEFYTTMVADSYYRGEKRDPSLVFNTSKPFGSLYGFWTSKGVLAPPDEPVGGYHCCRESGAWIIAAEGG